MRRPPFHPALAALALTAGLVSLVALAPAPARGQAEPWRPGDARPGRPADSIADTTVLLRVDADALTVQDFITRYYGSYPENRPHTDEAGRRAFLGTLENAMVLRRAALDRNRPFDFGERAIMREHTDRVLSNVLYQRAIMDSAQVTEPELREMFSMLKTEIRLREITFRQLAPAQRLYDQLRAKKITWEEAYRQHHQLEKKADLGDLGWVKRTVGEPTMVERIFRLQKGEYAEPWQDINGVHLVQCTETREGTPPPFEVIRARLTEIVRTPRVLDRTEQVAAVLRERIGMTYDTTNIVWAAQKFEDNAGISSSGGAPTLALGQRLPSFDIADSGRVLARHRDGRLTMFQFVEAYRAIPALARPAVNTPDRFRAQVDAVALEPYRPQLARERGYDKDPMAAEWIEKRRDELLVERLYQDSVESRIRVTEADARRYYDSNRAQYITYPAVTYAIWITKTREDADAMMARLAKGERLDAIVREDSLSAASRDDRRGSVRVMRQNEEGTDYYVELFGGELKPGDARVLGPDRENKFLVLQSLDFDPGRQLSFEESYRMVDEAARHRQAEELLQGFLERLKSRMKIVARPELLMSFEMKDPTL